MKKTLLFTGLLCGLTFSAVAQWTLMPSPTVADFDGIHFVDAQNGFIANGFGSAVVTSDGGNTWAFGTEQGYRDYSFFSSSVGYGASVVGMSIGKSTNSGATWTPITPPNGNSLWGVSAPSSTTAFFVGTGGVLWRTTSAGASVTQLNSGVTGLISDVFFTSTSVGFFVAQSGEIRQTTNSGNSWSTVHTTPNNWLTEMHFVDDNIGFVVGSEGLVVKTTDAGQSWVSLTTNSTSNLQGVHFYDADHGIVVGTEGTLLTTVDGGSTWVKQFPATTETLNDVRMLSATSAVVVGDSGTILKNDNITGLQEISQTDTQVNLFPNPVIDRLQITATHPITSVEVIDLLGNTLFASTFAPAQNQMVDFSGFASGAYLVRGTTSEGRFLQKVVR